GRSMWILDDVTPLHQITAQTAVSASVLFKPRDAVRARYAAGGRGGGRGGAPPLVEFPPAGAMIDYYLASAPSGPVTLEVLDANGKTVRTLSSEASVAAPDVVAAPEDPDAEPGAGGGGRGRGGGAAARLSKNVGLNRAIWDYNDAGGLALPPGAYRAKLTVGNWTATEPLTVRIDPRLAQDGITAADLRDQYDHNVRTR